MVVDFNETGVSRKAGEVAGNAADSACGHYTDQKVKVVRPIGWCRTRRMPGPLAEADPPCRGKHQAVRVYKSSLGGRCGEIIAGHGRVAAAKLLG